MALARLRFARVVRGEELVEPPEVVAADTAGPLVTAVPPIPRAHCPADFDTDYVAALREDACRGARSGVLPASHGHAPQVRARFERALRERSRDTSGRDSLSARVAEHGLQAIVAPTAGPAGPIDWVYGDRDTGPSSASLTAASGYPAVSVPLGAVEGSPVGLSLVGEPSEAQLLALADAYERATRHRVDLAYRATVR